MWDCDQGALAPDGVCATRAQLPLTSAFTLEERKRGAADATHQHTDPLRSRPRYLREDKHRLGRAYRKANPLERYVAAILDTNAHARQEPCVFYYLSDGPDGRPRMCGNPHFSRCIHQLQCIECEAFIDHEQAEAIEKREGAIVISVPVPLPPQVVAELNEQDEAGSDAMTELEALPPPVLPGAAL